LGDLRSKRRGIRTTPRTGYRVELRRGRPRLRQAGQAGSFIVRCLHCALIANLSPTCRQGKSGIAKYRNYLGFFPRPQVRVLGGQFVLGMLIALAIDWRVERRRRVYQQEVREVLRRNKIRNWKVGR